jgi:hypothetical protein
MKVAFVSADESSERYDLVALYDYVVVGTVSIGKSSIELGESSEETFTIKLGHSQGSSYKIWGKQIFWIALPRPVVEF